MQEVVKDKLKQTLRQQAASLTSRRLAVFKAFDNHASLSMNQLVSLLPQMDRATVYRTVKLFEDLGILNRILIGWKYKLELSDNFSPHHHHLNCTNCGKVIVLQENPTLEKHILRLSKQSGFQIVDHQLEIKGLCPTCQQEV